MPTVSATLKMFDQMTRPLQQVTQALNLTIRAMDDMNNSANKDIKITNSLNSAKGAIQRANIGLQELANSQNKATSNQNKLNSSFKKGSSEANELTSNIKSLVVAYAGLETIKKGALITDEYINQSVRLALINDGLQTQEQLQSKIYQSAQRAKASYGESLNAVAKLGLLAKNAFKSTDEIIAFTETMNKAFRISGAGTSEVTSAMHQITQAMASGRLQGDEFVSVLENAPMLAQAIADYTKVGMGKLKELSSEGAITSDIIKNALFSAADDINKKFDAMPKTFSSIWTSIKNTATMQFSEIMQRVNSFINTDIGKQVVQGIVNAIGSLVFVVGGLLDILMTVSAFFTTNWSTIAPIVWSIVAAFVAYNSALAINNGLKLLHIFYTGLQTVGIFMATVAQQGLNAALLACPLTWIIGLIIGLILVIGILIAYCEPVREGFAAAFEGVAQAVSFAFGIVVDTVQGAINFLIDQIQGIYELINSVTGAVSSLWGGSGTNFKIERVDFSGFKKSGKEAIKEVGSKGSSAIKSFTAENIKSTLSGAMSGITGMGNAGSSPIIPTVPEMGPVKGKDKKLDKGLKGANNHLKNIDDKIDVSNEHLEMMRDLAEKESIQNFVTLTPTVSITTGDIKEEADINKIISKIETYMENELVSSAEGVYA